MLWLLNQTRDPNSTLSRSAYVKEPDYFCRFCHRSLFVYARLFVRANGVGGLLEVSGCYVS